MSIQTKTQTVKIILLFLISYSNNLLSINYNYNSYPDLKQRAEMEYTLEFATLSES